MRSAYAFRSAIAVLSSFAIATLTLVPDTACFAAAHGRPRVSPPAAWSPIPPPPPPPFNPPTERMFSSAILDPVRNRMVVFGGVAGRRVFGDLWALSLSGTPEWTQLNVPGGPGPRQGHTAIYDPRRDRMIVFSGSNSDGNVWALSFSGSPTWSRLPPSPFGCREFHTAIYDPIRDRMIVFGGLAGGAQNDVWALSLSGTPTWTELHPTGRLPSPRSGAASIYDPIRDRLLVFGGWESQPDYSRLTYTNETWALDLSGPPAWSQLPSAPLSRRNGVALYDPRHDCAVIWGGYNQGGNMDDAWELELSGNPRWSSMSILGSHPASREGPSAIYDPHNRCLVAFGGYHDRYLNETWTLSLPDSGSNCKWSRLPGPPPMPCGRSGHLAVFDPRRDQMVVFGGRSDRALGDVWAVSLTGTQPWRPISAAGQEPTGRSGSAGIYDPVRDRLIVFGGYGSDLLNEVWTLSLSGVPEWRQIAPAGMPPAKRAWCTAVYDPERDWMVVVGGGNLREDRSDVWALDLSGSPRWIELRVRGRSPAPRNSPAVTYDPMRRRILFSGGENDGTTFSDTWALELKNGTAARWFELRSNPNAPAPRGARHAVYVPSHDRMVVFRGEGLTHASGPGGEDHPFGDVWALSLSGRDRWEQLAPSGAPPTAHAFGSAVYDPARARVVIFGGEDGLEKRNDTWSLNFTPPGVTADLALESPAIEPAPGASFALHGAAPNPAVGDWAISFSLPDAAPARLALITVAGRVLETRDVGSMGPGRHTLRIGPAHDLPAGIYFVRLSRGAQSLVTKLAMLR